MRVTPAAPLQLAAARLAGKCSHLVLALIVLGIPRCFFDEWLWARHTPVDDGLQLTELAFNGLFRTLWWITHTAAWGAVGLYFAARFRSLTAALLATAGVVLTYQLVCGPVVAWIWALWEQLATYYHQYPPVWVWAIPGQRLETAFLVHWMAFGAMMILANAILLRVFLMAAARQLAIRRGD